MYAGDTIVRKGYVRHGSIIYYYHNRSQLNVNLYTAFKNSFLNDYHSALANHYNLDNPHSWISWISLWRRAYARLNITLYFLYRQYINLFIFWFVSQHRLRSTLHFMFLWRNITLETLDFAFYIAGHQSFYISICIKCNYARDSTKLP